MVSLWTGSDAMDGACRGGCEIRHVPDAMLADSARLQRVVQEDRIPQGRRVY